MNVKTHFNKTSLLFVLKVGVPLIAVWLVWEQIHAIHFQAIKQTLSQANWLLLVVATLAIFAGIASMGFYDVLAFSLTEKQKLSARKRWFIGATLFGWTNFIGFGPALRAWLYSRYGYTVNEIGRGLFLHYTVSLCGLAAWATGVYMFSGTLAAYLAPLVLCIMLSLSLAWLIPKITLLDQLNIPVRQHKVFLQLATVAYLEWGLTILSFYWVVEAFGFAQLQGLASVQIAIQGWVGGIVSMVPGGLGTSDAIWLHLFNGHIQNPDAAAALVLSVRIVLYIAPWLVAVASLYFLILSENAMARRVQRQFITVLLAAQCAILLFSVATPYPAERLNIIADVLPLHFIESSHLISAVLGFSLIFLLQALNKGYRNAYKLAMLLLGICLITNVINGLDLLALSTTVITLVLLFLSRKDFLREGHLNMDLPYMFAAGGLGLVFFWIMGFIAFENVPYQPALWQTFEVNMQAPRFLRSAVLVTTVFLLFLVRNAFRPRLTTVDADESSIKKTEELTQQYGLEAESLLVGGGDKLVWWYEDKGFILYQVHRNKLLVFKNPQYFGEGEPKAFLQAFMSYCDSVDLEPYFSSISPEWMEHLHEFGFYFTKIAEEAIVDITSYNLQGSSKSGFRYIVKQIEKQNAQFEILHPPFDTQTIDQLRTVSDDWIREKGGHELQFNACYFSPPYIQRNSVAVVKSQEGEILAFVNLLTVPTRGEATVDLMRYKPGRMDNLMDYLLIKVFLQLGEQGYKRFSLGNAPMTDVGNTDTARLHEKLLFKLSERAERFYNYKGLRSYKGKFKPDWEPRYIAYRYPWNSLATLRLAVTIVRARSRKMRQRIAQARMAERYDQFLMSNRS